MAEETMKALIPQNFVYFDEYTMGPVSYWKMKPKGQFPGPEKGAFSQPFLNTGKSHFLFDEWKLFNKSNLYPKKILSIYVENPG